MAWLFLRLISALTLSLVLLAVLLLLTMFWAVGFLVISGTNLLVNRHTEKLRWRLKQLLQTKG